MKKSKYHPKRDKNKRYQKNIINTFKQLHLRLGQTRKDSIDVRYMTGGLVDHLREKCQSKWVGALLENRKYLLYIRLVYIYYVYIYRINIQKTSKDYIRYQYQIYSNILRVFLSLFFLFSCFLFFAFLSMRLFTYAFSYEYLFVDI